MVDAAATIVELNLEPHPEGGYFRRIYTAEVDSGRPALSMIHYLLDRGQHSRWHVVALDEIWYHDRGDPLEVITFRPGHKPRLVVLSDDRRHHVVPAGTWQAARAPRGPALCTCAVAPAFSFDDFRFVSDLPGHESILAGPLKAYRDLL